MRANGLLPLLMVASAYPVLGCLPGSVGIGVTIPVTPAPAPVALGPGFEVNVDRPGSDYRSFDLPAPQPQICRDSCMNEPACVAFTYVNPGVQGPSARCWLKSNVPPPNPSGCCVSGVKYASPPPPPPPMSRRPFERGINRPGSDYRNFDLPGPNPSSAARPATASPSAPRSPTSIRVSKVRTRVAGSRARCRRPTQTAAAFPASSNASGTRLRRTLRTRCTAGLELMAAADAPTPCTAETSLLVDWKQGPDVVVD